MTCPRKVGACRIGTVPSLILLPGAVCAVARVQRHSTQIDAQPVALAPRSGRVGHCRGGTSRGSSSEARDVWSRERRAAPTAGIEHELNRGSIVQGTRKRSAVEPVPCPALRPRMNVPPRHTNTGRAKLALFCGVVARGRLNGQHCPLALRVVADDGDEPGQARRVAMTVPMGVGFGSFWCFTASIAHVAS